MTPEEKRHGAFMEFDDLLLAGVAVDEALLRAAEDNELRPEVFRAVAEKHLGDLEAHRQKMSHRGRWEERQKAFVKREQELRETAATSAEGTYYACACDDPERSGRPSWPRNVAGLVERLQVVDTRLQRAVWDAYYATIERLDRKHRTHTSHFKD